MIILYREVGKKYEKNKTLSFLMTDNYLQSRTLNNLFHVGKPLRWGKKVFSMSKKKRYLFRKGNAIYQNDKQLLLTSLIN